MVLFNDSRPSSHYELCVSARCCKNVLPPKDMVGSILHSMPLWSRFVAYFLGAMLLAWVKLSFFTENELMTALWEETSIYLNAYHLSFGSFLFFPDAGYINFLPKLAAFLSLRTLGLVAVYPLALKYLCFFLSALVLLVFLSNRFFYLIPSVTTRFLLCLLLFFFPEHDFYASYNCSYYVVFLLCYYLIVLSSEFMLGKKEFIFILISAPVAVWSKPVFFFFGPIFLLIGVLQFQKGLKAGLNDWYKNIACLVLIALYACQLFFTIAFYPDLGASGLSELAQQGNVWQQALTLTVRFILFCGYGLAMPLNMALSPRIGFFLYGVLGVCIFGIFFVNLRFCFRHGQGILALLFITLIGCCGLSVYGILQSEWLFRCSFTDAFFNRPWDHRHLFPFIIFSTLQTIFFVERQFCTKSVCLSGVILIILTLASLIMVLPMGQGAYHLYSLTWPEARGLLKEPDPLIPIPQIMPEWLPLNEFCIIKPEPGKYSARMQGMFFSPRCNWFSGILTPHIVDVGSFAPERCDFKFPDVQSDRKIKYLLLFPNKSDQIFLPKETILTTLQGEVYTTARLVNPGTRSFYLFVWLFRVFRG